MGKAEQTSIAWMPSASMADARPAVTSPVFVPYAERCLIATSRRSGFLAELCDERLQLSGARCRRILGMSESIMPKSV